MAVKLKTVKYGNGGLDVFIELNTRITGVSPTDIVKLESTSILQKRDSYNAGTTVYFALPNELEIKLIDLIKDELLHRVNQ